IPTNSWRSSLEPLAREIESELSRFGPEAGMREVVDRWPDAVGRAIAANAWPARIARDGTLHVHTADSVWAFELGQRARDIAGRLAVARVRFAPGPLPEADVAEVAQPVVVRPEDAERARAIASSIGDEKLRESVQKAVSLGLARRRANPRF